VAHDPPHVAALKGDVRMATVIARAATAAIAVPDDGLTFRHRGRVIRISADEIGELVAAACHRVMPFSSQRERFRHSLARRAYDGYTGGVALATDEQEFSAAVLADPANRKAIDACWRSVNGVALVRSLLTQSVVLERAAEGVLSTQEQRLLRRPRAHATRWTAADLALLDEAEGFVKGPPRAFGHVVVDEAQDLSPMQLRMVARRARRHSMTVLGDLAQATGPAASVDWDDALRNLGRPPNAARADLTMGYRLPGSILALANRLLPFAAPAVQPSRSVRPDGDPPDVRHFSADDLLPAVTDHALALAKEFATVAVVTVDERVEEFRSAIETRGVVLADPGEVAPDRPLVVIPASLVKGLEFDAVVLVEPAEIADDGAAGMRLLFVALTRAVQHLAIAHTQDLPDALRA